MAQICARWLAADGTATEGDFAAFERASEVAWVWIDLIDPSEADLAKVASRFGFHALHVEDALHPQVRAKIDQYVGGLFVAWLHPTHAQGDGIVTAELDVFIGRDYLVTVRGSEVGVLSAVIKRACLSLRIGPAWMLHQIVDLLVDATLPMVDEIGEQLTAIEDAMLDNPRQSDLKDLHSVRRQLVSVHRILAPERDLLRELAREGDVISSEAYRYFQDVGDHVTAALESIETYQDVGASVMDVYLSAQSNRMNEIMKQLTVVATIFMPLTLISGIYGMNVTAGMWPPAGDATPWSFWAVIGFLLVLSLGMAAYFRKKNWW
jgi:magnesium transporter